MNGVRKQKRQDAVKALVHIALLEGAVLIAIVAIYLQTGNVTHLAGGVVASTLIFGPMVFRWFKEHGAALKSKPNSQTPQY